MRKKEKGFTLIEVMLVVIIIGIIAIIAIPKLLVAKATAEANSCLSNQQALQTAIEQYKWGEGSYPSGTSMSGLFSALESTTTVEGPYLPAGSSTSSKCPNPGTADIGLIYAGPTTGGVSCDVTLHNTYTP